MNESKQAMLELLPEIDDERRMFDRLAEITGGPLLAIANSLHVQRGIFSIPGASFYEQATIHYNEILKANAELAALRASAPQEDGRALEPVAWRYELACARYWGNDNKPGEYTDWRWRLSETKPAAGEGMRNVTALYPAPPSVALEALEPFAAISLVRDTDPNGLDMIDAPDLAITPNDVRRARAALSARSPNEN